MKSVLNIAELSQGCEESKPPYHKLVAGCQRICVEFKVQETSSARGARSFTSPVCCELCTYFVQSDLCLCISPCDSLGMDCRECCNSFLIGRLGWWGAFSLTKGKRFSCHIQMCHIQVGELSGKNGTQLCYIISTYQRYCSWRTKAIDAIGSFLVNR